MCVVSNSARYQYGQRPPPRRHGAPMPLLRISGWVKRGDRRSRRMQRHLQTRTSCNKSLLQRARSVHSSSAQRQTPPSAQSDPRQQLGTGPAPRRPATRPPTRPTPP
ncbi:hypothetical protein HMPREF0298_1701 [Corynebacterium lipophiloflavum DSM 44291]|uniref:Uncharacterized protein n=1 Tax=Corynebacterium lipophiloflavum (strain ATCC 700352 / DSM 44291 / CCUG 37336 / JCM 10383 / DMMZ 1944) TaxID=525263 RepID=C0XTD1_CORLD|nr:hypothetical protein HMPREF0298_1701 [Corynebacterium lipophiloflavum DSM 44291]